MLWLCFKLERLSLEIFPEHVEKSIALAVASDNPYPTILIGNRKAEKMGIKPGMTTSLAYEIAPSMIIYKRKTNEELEKIKEIAKWALQFTSMVTISKPNVLLLEIGGSIKLFKSATRIINKIKYGLKGMGFEATIAVAPTPLGAQYFTECGIEAQITNQKDLSSALERLPISVLEDCPKSVSLMSEMGIHYIRDLNNIPKVGIIRRFGMALIRNLEKAYGHMPDPQETFKPKECFQSQINLPYFIKETENLLILIQEPLLQMYEYLLARNIGLIKLAIIVKSENKEETTIIISLTQPTRDIKHINYLIKERLRQIQISEPFDTFSLKVIEESSLPSVTKPILSPKSPFKDEKNQIIETLRTRLGHDALYSLRPHADFRPEMAWHQTEPGDNSYISSARAYRPFWLLAKPRIIKKRNGIPWIKSELLIIDGPEKIESGWWDNKDIRRDYFIATNSRGSQFWIYRECEKPETWFLHGIFS